MAFVEFPGATRELIVKDSIQDVFESLEPGDADLAVAAITRTEARERHLEFGPSHQAIQHLTVCHRDAPRPATPENLVGRRLAERLDEWMAHPATENLVATILHRY